MSVRSLVTGGCGFIGWNVVRTLLEDGGRVRVLDIRPAPAEAAGLEYVNGSILDRATLLEAMRGVDVVYHLAATAGLWERDPSVYDRVNHRGTRVVLDAAGEAEVGALVHVSSATALARRPGILPKRETDPSMNGSPVLPDPRSTPGPYSRSKNLAERAVYEAWASGLPAVVTTVTTPVGPGDQTRTPPTQLLINLMRGRIPAMMRMSWHLSDVRDIARAICNAPARGEPGRRYVLSGETWSTDRLLGTLSTLFRRTMPHRRVPYPLAFAVASIGEAGSRLTGRAPSASVEAVRLSRATIDLSSEPDASDLGVTMRPVERSLADAVSWLQENVSDV